MPENNNVSESSIGGVTHNANTFKMTNLTHAGSMEISRQNGTFNADLLHDSVKNYTNENEKHNQGNAG